MENGSRHSASVDTFYQHVAMGTGTARPSTEGEPFEGMVDQTGCTGLSCLDTHVPRRTCELQLL